MARNLRLVLPAHSNRNDGTAFDVWGINTDEEYGEEVQGQQEIAERLGPQRLTRPALVG